MIRLFTCIQRQFSRESAPSSSKILQANTKGHEQRTFEDILFFLIFTLRESEKQRKYGEDRDAEQEFESIVLEWTVNGLQF